MKPLLPYYLRYFLIAYVVAIIIRFGFNLLKGGPINFVNILFGGIFFGLVLTYFIYYEHRSTLKRLGVTNVSSDQNGIILEKEISSPVPPDRLKDSFKSSIYMKNINVVELQNGYELTSDKIKSSAGDVTRIEFNTKNEELFQYKITARQKMRFQLMDSHKIFQHMVVLDRILKAV